MKAPKFILPFGLAFLGACQLHETHSTKSSSQQNTHRRELRRKPKPDSPNQNQNPKQSLICSSRLWKQAESNCLAGSTAEERDWIFEKVQKWEQRYGFFAAPQLESGHFYDSFYSNFEEPITGLQNLGCLRRTLCSE